MPRGSFNLTISLRPVDCHQDFSVVVAFHQTADLDERALFPAVLVLTPEIEHKP
jgi:hypothetical protein